MDILSLPDEMCGSILKYSDCEIRKHCRRISERLNNIIINYGLKRQKINTLRIHDFLEMDLPFRMNNHQKIANLLKKKENNLHQDNDLPANVKPKILIISMNLKWDDFNCSRFRLGKREICKRYIRDEEKYRFLDDLLIWVELLGTLTISSEDYDKKLDECFYRNKESFKYTRRLQFESAKVTCTPGNSKLLKALKKLEYFGISPKKTVNIGEVLKDYDGGFILLDGLMSRLRPADIGNSFLQKRMKKLPDYCSLTGYRNNFTIPVFAEFLVLLILSNPKESRFDFGVLSRTAGNRDQLHNRLRENNIDFECQDWKNTEWHYQIHQNGGTRIVFYMEK